jgi:hypothetical protein
MLPHTLGRDACPMKQPAGSGYDEFRICGLWGDTLVGGYDRVGVQFRVVEFGVDVTRRPLSQLQRRPRWNRLAPAPRRESGGFQQFSDAAQVVNFLSMGLKDDADRGTGP